jgi:hypothetical protein
VGPALSDAMDRLFQPLHLMPAPEQGCCEPRFVFRVRSRVVLQTSATAGGLAFAVLAKRGRLVLSRIKARGQFCTSPMTVDALPPLTAEQLASLVDLAMVTPSPKIPALHLTRLMVLGYVM